jgi:putative endonuclease
MNWQVYIIHCSDDSLYTGITTDLQRRFDQHATGRGAKYFRGRQPQQIVYKESGLTRSTASSREREIKNLERSGKLALISSGKNEVTRL